MSRGLVYALLAYLAWGFLPLYWKMLGELPAWEILAHRVFWSGVFLAVLLLFGKRWREFRAAVSGRKTAGYLLLCSAFISTNWLIFIWAVNNGHVVESSLGYYITPLLNVLMGVVFMKERLHAGHWTAIGLAFTGVAVITVEYGRLPWVSLALALSFAIYGLLKKRTPMDAISGLAWETFFVMPLAACYIGFLGVSGQSGLQRLDAVGIVFLLLAGAVTVMPLYWFALAAKELPLTTMGFLQYVGPSISLVLGVTAFHEKFDTVKAVSFGLIWAGLAVYSLSSLKKVPAGPDALTAPEHAGTVPARQP